MVRELDASEFTRLPEELYYRGEPTEWSKTVRPGKRLHSFLEGPSFDRDGNLYVAERGNKILRPGNAGSVRHALAERFWERVSPGDRLD